MKPKCSAAISKTGCLILSAYRGTYSFSELRTQSNLHSSVQPPPQPFPQYAACFVPVISPDFNTVIYVWRGGKGESWPHAAFYWESLDVRGHLYKYHKNKTTEYKTEKKKSTTQNTIETTLCVPILSASLNAICIAAKGKLETSQVLAASKNFVTSFEHLKYVYPIDFIKLHFH